MSDDIKRFYKIGAGRKYSENFEKIKWGNEKVEIQEFVDKPKEEGDLAEWFYPTANSLSESYGRKWEGRVPILVEKAWHHQQKRINDLEKEIKELKAMWKNLYKSSDERTWLYEMKATVDSYLKEGQE